MTDRQLYSDLSTLPPDLKKQVGDFIGFLKNNSRKRSIQKKRRFGSAKGFFKINDDFDKPLEDFKDYM